VNKTKFLILAAVLVLAGGLLSGCAGAGSIAAGAPGITVQADQVYLASGASIYALDLQTGAERTTVNNKGETVPLRFPTTATKNLSIDSAPAIVADGQMVVGNGSSQDRSHAFFSFDPQTFASTAQPWPYIGADDIWMGSALVFNGVIYAPNSDGAIYALSPDGALLGKFLTGQSIWATPVTDGTDLYVASLDHYVYKATPSNLDQALWGTELDASIVAAPALGDGVLYAGTINNSLYALDAATGKILWHVSLAGGIWASPALDASAKTLYVGAANNDSKCTSNCGALYAINPQDGKTIWQLDLAQAVTAAPVVHEDKIYFVTEDGIIRAVDSDKKPVWQKQTDGVFYSSPVLAGELLLVAPMRSKTQTLMVAYTLDGEEKWSFSTKKK